MRMVGLKEERRVEGEQGVGTLNESKTQSCGLVGYGWGKRE